MIECCVVISAFILDLGTFHTAKNNLDVNTSLVY